MNFPVFSQLGSENARSVARLQHAPEVAAPLRRFGEPGGGDSATSLCVTILTACGFHLTPIPLFVPASALELPGSAEPYTVKRAHPFAKPPEPPWCPPTAMSSLWFPFARSDQTARSSQLRRKASLINGFNSLLGHNYFPVPLRREFDSKFLILLVLLVKNLDIGSQNR